MQITPKRETIEVSIVIITTIIAFVLVIFFLPSQRSKVYDCSLAEISPDFPPAVREECRRIRAKNI